MLPPPTDSELLKLGLGFDTSKARTLTPPDIIAADLINSYRTNNTAPPIHTSSYLSPPPKNNATNYANIPTDVRAAVEMAKAHKRGNIPYNRPTSIEQTYSHDREDPRKGNVPVIPRSTSNSNTGAEMVDA